MKQHLYFATALLALATISAQIFAEVHMIKHAKQLDKLFDKHDFVVVKFSADDWCGPCKAFSPIFKTVAHELEGKVAFAIVDGSIKENKREKSALDALTADYGVKGFPTTLFFKDGEKIGKANKRDAKGFKKEVLEVFDLE